MTQPLLVTGAHRSGTSWVGRMLAAGGAYTYINEPLNVHHRPGVMDAPVTYWYTYICAENEDLYLRALQNTLALDYKVGRELLSLRVPKDAGRMLRDMNEFSRGQREKRQPLLKDPFAVFSTPWFAQRLNCKVLFTVRHPAAFVSSLQNLGWGFDFSDLLNQPLLMRDLLSPYEEQMQFAQQNLADMVLCASLLWRIIYQHVHTVRESHTDFLAVRHEDLSLQPLEEYQALYDALGIHYNARAQAFVNMTSSPRNPQETDSENVHSVTRDSRASVRNWAQRLSADEIGRVRDLTADTWPLYYSDDDWQP